MTSYYMLWSDGPVYANQAVEPMTLNNFLDEMLNEILGGD